MELICQNTKKRFYVEMTPKKNIFITTNVTFIYKSIHNVFKIPYCMDIYFCNKLHFE